MSVPEGHEAVREGVGRLPQYIQSLEALWAQAANEAFFDYEALEKVYYEAHTLNGFGAVYHLAAVSERAARLAEIVESIRERPTRQQQIQVETALQDLKEVVWDETAKRDRSEADVLAQEEPAEWERLKDAPVEWRLLQGCVLIVDDAEMVRHRLRVGLEAIGLQVVEAVDEKEALEQARRHRPHLILMDLRMPGMNGFEAQRLVRDEAGLANTAIVFLTSARMISAEEIQEALFYGVQGYLTKTMPMAQIIEKVKSVLSTHQRAGLIS